MSKTTADKKLVSFRQPKADQFLSIINTIPAENYCLEAYWVPAPDRIRCIQAAQADVMHAEIPGMKGFVWPTDLRQGDVVLDQEVQREISATDVKAYCLTFVRVLCEGINPPRTLLTLVKVWIKHEGHSIWVWKVIDGQHRLLALLLAWWKVQNMKRRPVDLHDVVFAAASYSDAKNRKGIDGVTQVQRRGLYEFHAARRKMGKRDTLSVSRSESPAWMYFSHHPYPERFPVEFRLKSKEKAKKGAPPPIVQPLSFLMVINAWLCGASKPAQPPGKEETYKIGGVSKERAGAVWRSLHSLDAFHRITDIIWQVEIAVALTDRVKEGTLDVAAAHVEFARVLSHWEAARAPFKGLPDTHVKCKAESDAVWEVLGPFHPRTRAKGRERLVLSGFYSECVLTILLSTSIMSPPEDFRRGLLNFTLSSMFPTPSGPGFLPQHRNQTTHVRTRNEIHRGMLTHPNGRKARLAITDEDPAVRQQRLAAELQDAASLEKRVGSSSRLVALPPIAAQGA